MLEFAAICGAISVIIGTLALIWNKVILPIARLVRKSHKAFDKVLSYDDRLTTIETRTLQLEPNSGSHMRDDVTAIREMIKGHIEHHAAREAEIKAEIVLDVLAAISKD